MKPIKKRGRPVTPGDVQRIETALRHLQSARSYLRDAGANKAAEYVQRAIKSTQGACNNAQAHLPRQERNPT